MTEGRFKFRTTLEGYINALKPGGKFNNCVIGFKIPPDTLPAFEACYEKALAWGANKMGGKRHEKALPKWEEDGTVTYNYNGEKCPPMFPWIDTEGNPIDPDTPVWKGTVVNLIVDTKPYVYGNKVGLSFKVRGAQVVKLVGPDGGQDAGELDVEDVAALFGTPEGFKQSSPNFVPPETDGDEGVSPDDEMPF